MTHQPNLKCREGVCLPSPEWELLPQQRSLVAEVSTSHSTLTDSIGITSESVFWEIFDK